jgi:hypothetical protein
VRPRRVGLRRAGRESGRHEQDEVDGTQRLSSRKPGLGRGRGVRRREASTEARGGSRQDGQTTRHTDTLPDKNELAWGAFSFHRSRVGSEISNPGLDWGSAASNTKPKWQQAGGGGRALGI